MIKNFVKWVIWMFQNKIVNESIKSYIPYNILWKSLEWKEIKCYNFWNWNEKIIYFWWIHWNEVWTVKLMNKWINFLYNNEKLIPEDKQIFLINCLNIDLYNLALRKPNYFWWWSIWKQNSNNVDLNRNFPTKNWSKESKMFLMWKYYGVSSWEFWWSEPEVKVILDLVKKENIKTIYEYHNCWWNVMSNFRLTSDKKASEYIKKSWFKLFSKSDWDKLDELHKTWNINVWWFENDIDVIEIENKTRYLSEWKTNKKALINSLYL